MLSWLISKTLYKCNTEYLPNDAFIFLDLPLWENSETEGEKLHVIKCSSCVGNSWQVENRAVHAADGLGSPLCLPSCSDL